MAVVTSDSVTPNSGSGFSQTFVFKYSDDAGAANLTQAWVWFTDVFSLEQGVGRCLFFYDRPTNTINLLNDAGTSYLTAPIGASVTLQSRVCTINVGNSSVVFGVTQLTLTVDVTFTGDFVGTKHVWMYAQNGIPPDRGDNSGWQDRGDWIIPLPLVPTAVGANWVKGSTVVSGALRLIGVLGQGGSPTAPQMSEGMRRLNMMMGQWFLQNQTSPFISRDVFPLFAYKQRYTVGFGGEIDIPRMLKLDGLGLLMDWNYPAGSIPVFPPGGAPQPVEIPRAIFTDDAWQHIQIKGLTNSLFTGGYYRATYASGYGSLELWPIPNNALHSVVLYTRHSLPLFVSETTQYDIPEGAEEAMEYNLAVRLAAPNTVPVPPDVAALARTSLANFKRSNNRFNDIPIDPMFAPGGGRRGRYNINTGTGG